MATVIHGDCLEVMAAMEAGSVDAVVTDPPYGVGLGVGKDTRRDGHGLGKCGYVGYEDSLEDFTSSVVPRIALALSIAKRGAVFMAGHRVQMLPQADTMGGVYCPAASGRHCWGFNTFVPILYYGKDPELHTRTRPTVLQSTARAEKNGHPCPKPIEWMRWIVQRVTMPGDTVLDPFMGSGTTGVACVELGRHFIGIEREGEYVEIARRRIEQAAAQTRMEMSA